MRSSRSCVVALLAGAVGLLPATVVAQGNGFLIQSYPSPGEPSINVVQCPDVKSKPPTVTCTIVYKTKYDTIPCKPGACSFQQKPAADAPSGLTYGVSTFNPTCAWVYHSGLYYSFCW